ncbi:MAG: hypothetical protein Q4E20_04815 [Eubacteriales bacterium]|nr:hypothetical protein [Eubacteriales bacterium]
MEYYANTTTPMETQTRGRIYVTVNSENNPAFISFYDAQGKRTRTIDLLRAHDGKMPHAHDGYTHGGEAADLTDDEKKLLARVRKVWYDNKGK